MANKQVSPKKSYGAKPSSFKPQGGALQKNNRSIKPGRSVKYKK